MVAVPLDAEGNVTIYGFCAGYTPFMDIVSKAELSQDGHQIKLARCESTECVDIQDCLSGIIGNWTFVTENGLDFFSFSQIVSDGSVSYAIGENYIEKPVTVIYTDDRRADIGEYRIIYRVDADTVKIAVVGKRNDSQVYKKSEIREVN